MTSRELGCFCLVLGLLGMLYAGLVALGPLSFGMVLFFSGGLDAAAEQWKQVDSLVGPFIVTGGLLVVGLVLALIPPRVFQRSKPVGETPASAEQEPPEE